MIPEPPRRKDGRGRPWRGRREVLDGILFILRTGAAWADLPYRSYQTCHRCFQQWVRSGVMRAVLDALAEGLRSRGGFDLEEAFIDESIRFRGARFGNFGGWPNFLYQPRFTNCVSRWPGSAR